MRRDWEEIYRENTAAVLNYIAYRSGDRDSAEDLCATTFERAWRRRRSFDPGRGSARAWLIGIARRVVADGRRKGRQELGMSDFEAFADPSAVDPQEEAIALEAVAVVRLAVSSLPEREREVIAMKFGADLTNREIARTTGLSESHVGTIVHRSLARLRAVLKEDLDETG